MSRLSFFALVKQMREAQRTYYQTRDKDILRKSIELEKRVDEEITRGDAYLQAHPELLQSEQPSPSSAQ